MPWEPNDQIRGPETRRQFIKKTGLITAGVAAAGQFPFSLRAAEGNPGVSIVLDPAENLTRQTPVQWAAGQLHDALVTRGVNATLVSSLEQAPPENLCVFVTRSAGKPESLVLVELNLSDQRRGLLASGSDERGLVYALLELADRVNHAKDPRGALRVKKPIYEHPANTIRSVSRLFTSDVEDKPWYNDKAFWQNYLTMLAMNRFNRFNLGFGLGYDFTTGITDCYFHFAYPFLLSVPGYEVNAVPLPDSERDANLEMLQFISNEAARRGLQFQLGLWTHAYEWTDSPRANYVITGLTPKSQGPYCRDAIRLLLTQCPNITGVTIRTHGESGVPEGEIEIWKTIFSGVAGCGRKVEIDLHAKGINQSIIDSALATGMPVTISPKFWAEHMGLPYMQGAIRPQEMPPRDKEDNGFFSRSSGSRSFLRYGYGDLFEKDRRYGVLHRIWPGTQRVLLWGDPETAAAYGRVAGFCGGNGVEVFEPLTFKGRKGSGLPYGRNAYADSTLNPVFDFEKYEYTYRVWGRNLYNPDNDGEGWRRYLGSQCGRDADSAESALSSAGKILPLITTAYCPSAANNNYWPEMYWNMPMADAQHKNPYSDTPSPKRFGTVSPLDPEFFSNCDEFALELQKGMPSGKKSPVWVAARLDEYAEKTQSAMRRLNASNNSNATVRRVKIDAAIQAGLGRFFAAKFRAGVYYSLYLNTQNPEWIRESLEETRAARAVWAEVANFATGVYVDDVTYGPEYFQRGHWSDRLGAMDADIADIEVLALAPPNAGSNADLKNVRGAIHEAAKGNLNWRPGKPPGIYPAPPTSFRRGDDLALIVLAKKLKHFRTVANLELRYRHVNQGEPWQEVQMKRVTHKFFGATIPAAYTDSPFPLQYYFRMRLKSGGVVLCPGLESLFDGQPYFVVRQA